MRETKWVELVANIVRTGLADHDQFLKIETQLKILYSYEIRTYSDEPETEMIWFATNLSLICSVAAG